MHNPKLFYRIQMNRIWKFLSISTILSILLKILTTTTPRRGFNIYNICDTDLRTYIASCNTNTYVRTYILLVSKNDCLSFVLKQIFEAFEKRSHHHHGCQHTHACILRIYVFMSIMLPAKEDRRLIAVPTGQQAVCCFLIIGSQKQVKRKIQFSFTSESE